MKNCGFPAVCLGVKVLHQISPSDSVPTPIHLPLSHTISFPDQSEEGELGTCNFSDGVGVNKVIGVTMYGRTNN